MQAAASFASPSAVKQRGNPPEKAWGVNATGAETNRAAA
jgi:hypothetical protein